MPKAPAARLDYGSVSFSFLFLTVRRRKRKPQGMSSLGISTSAFLALAQRAPRNRVAWLQLSEILLRVCRSTPTWAESIPPGNRAHPMNTAVVIFQSIGIIAAAGFSSNPSAADKVALILRLRPYIVTCTTRFINDIIVPGREAEFQSDFPAVLANLVAALASAQLDAAENSELIAFRVPEELQRTGSKFFLTCVLTQLLFPTSSPPRFPSQQVLSQCFVTVGYVLGLEPDPHSLPPYAQELYDALGGQSEKFAALFLSCTVDAISRLRTERLTLQGPAYLLEMSYRAMDLFLFDERVISPLLRNGFIRWTCEMMVTTSRTNLYHRMVDSAELSDLSKRGLFYVGYDCVNIGCKQLSVLIGIYGAPIVQQAYECGGVLSAARIQHLCFRYLDVAGRDTYLPSLDSLVKLLTQTSPYLVYYSVLKTAMHVRRRMKPLLTPEAMNNPALKVYEKRIDELGSLSEFFERKRPTICDSCQCPNLGARHRYPLRCCSGCRVKFYCSQVCQRSDWYHRHRAKCHTYHAQLEANTCRAICSRDVLFLNYILHDIMHAHRFGDVRLVRHVDLTASPPTVVLRSLGSDDTALKEILASDNAVTSDGSERVPLEFYLPMGLNSIKRIRTWDHSALQLGVEDTGKFAGMYDPINSFV